MREIYVFERTEMNVYDPHSFQRYLSSVSVITSETNKTNSENFTRNAQSMTDNKTNSVRLFKSSKGPLGSITEVIRLPLYYTCYCNYRPYMLL